MELNLFLIFRVDLRVKVNILSCKTVVLYHRFLSTYIKLSHSWVILKGFSLRGEDVRVIYFFAVEDFCFLK